MDTFLTVVKHNNIQRKPKQKSVENINGKASHVHIEGVLKSALVEEDLPPSPNILNKRIDNDALLTPEIPSLEIPTPTKGTSKTVEDIFIRLRS